MVVKRRLRQLDPPTSPAPQTARCGLCGRPLPADATVDQHHLVPRSQGGRATVPIHRICHQKIHSVLTERELASAYATFEALRAVPKIARFVQWVAGKPASFYDRSKRRRR
ncbi:HNH endonuclease signature motif containing protein [Chitinasiproducens palmae]|uniref:HNH endonuclease signature motif containing protein n=1 Tax=Chitinasiproducens palmae TaxID=1770053 RepID=UPI000B885AC4|nr:HNH endonuclease signature motif containing protein [Chitinasiproducens palmae]